MVDVLNISHSFHFQKEHHNLITSVIFAALIMLLISPAIASAQETTVNIFPNKDNYLREETNTRFLKYGMQPYIFVGNYTTTRRFTGVMQFTIPPAQNPGDKIAKIKLNLYYYNSGGGNGSDIIQALELLEDFSESNSNYYARDTTVNWTTAGAIPPGSSSATVLGTAPVDTAYNVWKSISLKEDAMSGVNWSWGESRGIMLTTSGKTGKALYYNFVSKDSTSSAPFANADQYLPYIEITYGDDTIPPAISGVSSADTSFIVLSRTLAWQTDEPSTTVIKYGMQSGNYPSVKSNDTKTTAHSFKIDGLKPGTTYYFVVNSTDIYGNSAQSSEYSFTTSSAKSVHPFLMFERIEDVPGYKYRTQTPWKTWEASIISAAKSAVAKNFSDTNWRMYDQSKTARYLGFVYQVTKNTTYAEKAKDALLNLENDRIDYDFERSDGAMNYGLTYDWVQPYLDSQTDSIIRDKLATLADQVYYDLNDGETNRKYVTFADYHGKAYPAVGVIGAALFDYDNPNNLPLKSTPLDWVKVGTEYLFVNDKLHDFNRALISHSFDNEGKHVSGSYKAYVIEEFIWWFQAYSGFTGNNIFDVYPLAKKSFTSELWESMPNYYHNNFITDGNTKKYYFKGILNLLDSEYRSYALNHLDKVEAPNLLPYSASVQTLPNDMLYLVYGDYSSVSRATPIWLSHLSKDSLYQVFRGNWSVDSDWLAMITWNFKDYSNRNMGHHDQLSLEYYSRGDLLLADAGEHKHVLGVVDYSEQEIYHNVIAIEDPRSPFPISSWANSAARGIYKGDASNFETPATINNIIQTPWMETIDSKATVGKVIGNSWSEYYSLSSPIQYGRTILYTNKEYFAVIDRMDGTESWTYRTLFRPTSLNIFPTDYYANSTKLEIDTSRGLSSGTRIVRTSSNASEKYNDKYISFSVANLKDTANLNVYINGNDLGIVSITKNNPYSESYLVGPISPTHIIAGGANTIQYTASGTASLNITSTSLSRMGYVQGDMKIGNNPYNWLALPYKTETVTGITTNTINWNTTNPYGNNVEMNLFSAPSSEIIVEKNLGRIAGYGVISEVFSPLVYFKTPPTNNLYRVTVLLSKYSSEEQKMPSEIPVTGTGSAVKVNSLAYDDYIYSGKGVSSFASFSTDADTVYARKASEPIEYTLINGSYVNYSGAPLISASKKVDYISLQKEGNTTTFEVKGAGTAQVTLKGNSGSNYIVKRDGVLYTNFVKSGNNLVITSELD